MAQDTTTAKRTQQSKVSELGFQVGPDLYVREVNVSDLKEQEVNANVMPPKVFDRLVENIRERKALESLPYVVQAGGEGDIEICSGHHRVRAARAAGHKRIAVLVDTSVLTRSQIVSKQLSHNALTGIDDEDVLKQLAAMIDTPDDRLATGLPDDLFQEIEKIDIDKLFMPRVSFDYRTITFAFLPHQQAELERLVHLAEGSQDLVMITHSEQFEELIKQASQYAKFKKVLSGGSAIVMMIRAALAEIEAAEEAGQK